MPGSTYNHTYCDIPVKSSRSSHVSRALDAGFSTFGIDRLATGRSTLPPSSRYTLDSGTEAIHQAVTRLRGGGIRNGTFDKIVRVGHSLGSSMAWARAEKHDGDIDAFVLTGMSHVVRDEDPSGGAPQKTSRSRPGPWTTPSSAAGSTTPVTGRRTPACGSSSTTPPPPTRPSSRPTSGSRT
ncbi:alpha/beta fold hydrolase [Streptomyces olivaceus]